MTFSKSSSGFLALAVGGFLVLASAGVTRAEGSIDLTVLYITVEPSDNLEPGDIIAVGYAVCNDGSTSTACAPWDDCLHWSNDLTFGDADDVELGCEFQLEDLNPGECYIETTIVTVPDSCGENDYILLKTDTNLFCPESNENNNVGSASVSCIDSPPPAPSNLLCAANGCASIDLFWNDNSNNEDEFEIFRSTNCSNYTEVRSTGPNDVDWTDFDVDACTTYCYQVRARNSAGSSGFSNTAECTTDCGPPDCCVSDGDCDNGLFCDGQETCVGGVCQDGPDPCVGGPECADSCNESADNCYEPSGTPCSSDGNECTGDVCNGSGSCTHDNEPTGTPCGSSNNTDCDDPDTCQSGSCQSNYEPSGTQCTDDGNECTDDACNGSGVCDHNNAPTGTPCGSSNDTDCDDPDTCQSGSCQPNYEASGTQCLDDGNNCTDDICDGLGGCDHPTVSDPNCCPTGESCDDGDLCTDADVCIDGVCAGSPIEDCCESDADCDADEVCSVDTNTCIPDGCVIDDDCADDGNPCTTQFCDAEGECQSSHNTDPCDDSDICTDGDVCADGVCAGSPIEDCCESDDDCDPNELCNLDTNTCDPSRCVTDDDCPDDGNPCTTKFCDTESATCDSTNTTDPCDDGDVCTDNDVCADGVCAGSPIEGCCESDDDCADEVPCTVDACMSSSCEFTLEDDDGDGVCNGDDDCPETPSGESVDDGGCRSFTFTLVLEDGTAPMEVMYRENEVVPVEPPPASAGEHFDHWEGDVPEGHEQDNPLTLTMDSNKTLTAVYESDEPPCDDQALCGACCTLGFEALLLPLGLGGLRFVRPRRRSGG